MATEWSPAFQRYPKDYLSDINVQSMTIEEEGCYNRLMDYCWIEGSLPCNPEDLAPLCKGVTPSSRVVACFTVFGDRLRHLRLDAEREKQADWRRKSAEGGKRSAHKRKHKRMLSRQQGGTTTVVPETHVPVEPLGNIAVCSLQSLNTPIPPKGAGGKPENLFETFYRAYPRHENPMGAQKAFEKAGITANDLPQILDWIEKASKSSQWAEKDKIPMATTFLNQRRWLGDPPPAANGSFRVPELPVDPPGSDPRPPAGCEWARDEAGEIVHPMRAVRQERG